MKIMANSYTADDVVFLTSKSATASEIDPMKEVALHQSYHEYMYSDKYVTRGSKVACTCGTKPSKVDLPVDHGITSGEGAPILTCLDSTANKNIHAFGNCTLRKNSPSCVPVVSQTWKEFRNQKTSFAWVEGAKAYGRLLTEGAYLTCSRGGYIMVVEVPATKTLSWSGKFKPNGKMRNSWNDIRALMLMEQYYKDNDYVSEIVDDDGICIFGLEGLGWNSGKGKEPFFPNGRYGAMMVVTKGDTVEFATYSASTLPSDLVNPDPEKSNPELSILNEAVYDLGGRKHVDSYAALQLYKLGTSTSMVNTIRVSRDSGKPYKSEGNGNNIHTAPLNTEEYYSEGCQIITTQEYIAFLLATDCVDWSDIWVKRIAGLEVIDRDEFEGQNGKGIEGTDRVLTNGKYEEHFGIYCYKDLAEEMTYLHTQFKSIENMRYVLDRTYMPETQKKAFKLDIKPSETRE